MKQKPILQTAGFIVSKKQAELDLKIIKYDIWATIAHVLMLNKQNLLDSEKTKKILNALVEIEKEVKTGNFVIDPNKGAQLTLETKIVEKAGDSGYSMHTGRSRNDQIAVAELLYLREEILEVFEALKQVMEQLLMLSKKYQYSVMPGYTHMQPAKPTVVSEWALAYLNAFVRASEALKFYYELYDINPLGACEGYGTAWNLDREYTTKLLAFKKVWEIPQDAISSRGFAQYNYLHAFSEISLIASKIAQDLILFNTFEFNMVSLGEEVAQRMHPITGSSVMAQKKNPDVLELIRATNPQIVGLAGIAGNILSALPMGYNRDSREVKEYMEMGYTKTLAVLRTLKVVLQTLEFNEDRMKELVINNYSLTTDLADYIAKKTNIGYRLIYKIVGQVVDKAIHEEIMVSDISSGEIVNEAKKLNINLDLKGINIKKITEPNAAIRRRYDQEYLNKHYKNAKKEMETIAEWTKERKTSIASAYDQVKKLVDNILA